MIIWAVRLLVLAWYLWHMNPHCGFYDAIAFLWSAERGFDLNTNATSHFLYNNVQHLLVIGLPWLNPVAVLGLFNIGCSWAALILFHRSQLRHHAAWKAHLAMMTLAFSFTWWQQTETIEVYGMSNLMFMLYAIPALEWNMDRSKRYPGMMIHGWLGLAMLTHIQHILAYPMLIWQCWQLVKTGRVREIFTSGISFAMLSGLCLLAWCLPGQSVRAVFTDRQFGDEVFATDISTVLSGAGKGLAMLCFNLHLWLLVVIAAIRKHDLMGKWTVPLLAAAVWFGFAMRYDVADNHVFYMPAYVVLLWMMPFGLPDHAVIKRVSWLLPWISVVMYFGVWQGALLTTQGRQLDEEKSYKGGLAYLIWPGKREAPDPFVLADSLKENPVLLNGHEWKDGYGLAASYLEWKRSSD